jgi:hypothetical protein
MRNLDLAKTTSSRKTLGVIMNQEIPFNEKIGELLQRFNRNHDFLFHYTSSQAAESISQNKEIHLTRADYLIDKREIKYGINIFKKQAENILSNGSKDRFAQILEILSNRFDKCFILCFSNISDSKKHQEIHGDEGLIKFNPIFPTEFAAMSYHAIEFNDGFAFTYSTDIYKPIQGHVIYDYYSQLDLAKEIIKTFNEINKEPTHIVDQFRFVDILLNFIMLCKEECYDWEKEFRVGLIANEKWLPALESVNSKGKPCIKLKIPIVTERLK